MIVFLLLSIVLNFILIYFISHSNIDISYYKNLYDAKSKSYDKMDEVYNKSLVRMRKLYDDSINAMKIDYEKSLVFVRKEYSDHIDKINKSYNKSSLPEIDKPKNKNNKPN